MIKALIFDLDNTIFATKSISDEVFAGIYELIQHHRGNISNEDFENIRAELSRTAFQKVAGQYKFSDELRAQGVELLKGTTYDKPIQPYKDYESIRSVNLTKFLVTFGFMKLQQSKIDSAGVRNDFKEVIVVDPEISSETKRDVFVRLMEKYGYKKDELIVIGDDPESEIAAARDLGIKTYLYDPESRFKSKGATWHEPHYHRLTELAQKAKQL